MVHDELEASLKPGLEAFQSAFKAYESFSFCRLGSLSILDFNIRYYNVELKVSPARVTFLLFPTTILKIGNECALKFLACRYTSRLV